MHWFFGPAIQLGSRLSFKLKFLLWSGLMLIPLLYSMGSLLSRLHVDNATATQEQAGLSILKSVPAVEQALLKHRYLMAQKYYVRPPVTADQILASRKEVTQVLHQFGTERANDGHHKAAFDALLKEWQSLEADADKLEQDQSFDRNEKVLTDLRRLYRSIAAGNALVQDPDFGAYFMVILASERLPAIRDLSAQVRDRAGTIADFGMMSAEGESALRFRINLVLSTVKELEEDLKLLYQLKPEYQQRVGGQIDDTVKQIRDAAEVIQQKLLKDQDIQMTAAQALELGNKLDAVLANTTQLSLDCLAQDLQKRVSDNQRKIALVSLAMLVVLALYFYLMIGSYLSIKETVERVKTVANRVNNQDLSQQIKIEGSDELADISRHYNTTLSTLRGLMQQVKGNSNAVVQQVTEIEQRTTRSQQVIGDQQGETHQVATAIKQLAATSTDMASTAISAAQMTHQTQQVVEEGEQVLEHTILAINNINREVRLTSEAIELLDKQCNQIGGVVDVIQGIAEQTNLLALNAAIEAARAGDMGRGFAVVADEVRSLAGRTQSSTHEIQKMIEQLQSGARASVQAMSQANKEAHKGLDLAGDAKHSFEAITDRVRQMVDSNTVIASAIEEQGAVALEIERNIVRISDGSDEALSVANSANEAARQIYQLTQQLQDTVQKFVL